MIAAARGERAGFSIFGTDYDTRDGTAVRDYVHVLDLAGAHVLALRHLLSGGASKAFNLGSGTGATVREMVDAVTRVSGRPITVTEGPRREGDSPTLVADNSRATRDLGWRPAFDIDQIIGTAWAWQARPAG